MAFRVMPKLTVGQPVTDSILNVYTFTCGYSRRMHTRVIGKEKLTRIHNGPLFESQYNTLCGLLLE